MLPPPKFPHLLPLPRFPIVTATVSVMAPPIRKCPCVEYLLDFYYLIIYNYILYRVPL